MKWVADIAMIKSIENGFIIPNNWYKLSYAQKLKLLTEARS